MARPPTRQSTMTESDYGLEMAEGERDTDLENIPELPESVAGSPLFTLPREIRDKIYMFCLTRSDSLPVDWLEPCKEDELQPQLLRTCKTIYREAAALLYTRNIIAFHHPSDSNMFARAMACPTLSRKVANVCLHIKAQDTRLWMPYLTSNDPHRGLRSDFPELRELNVRFRSNKWQHNLSPEHNLRLWNEDSRLDEIVDGLRHSYFSDGTHKPQKSSDLEMYRNDLHVPAPAHESGDSAHAKRFHEMQKAFKAFNAARDATPTIKVLCACRVQAAHFNALTDNTSAAPTANPIAPPAAGVAAAALQQLQQQRLPAPPANEPPPAAVTYGEPFRGFTAIDLRSNMKNLYDARLGGANIARTPYTDRNGILLSLEIHHLDPKRNENNSS